MDLDLTRWKRDWALMSSFFSAGEITEIADRLKGLKISNLVFCSFENRFARSGGLASVTTNILPYFKEVSMIPVVILLTPYYLNISHRGKLKPVTSCNVRYHNKNNTVDIYEYTWKYTSPQKGRLKEYFLKCEGFFDSKNRMNDPYLYDESSDILNDRRLVENALFFSRAVPLALNALGITKDIVFHLQEWQTALIALTAKEAMLNGTLYSCGTAQTMHNSYDASIPWDMLKRAVDDKRKKLISQFPGESLTAYQVSLQLVDAPITTVSSHFASEFTSDTLQTEHFAPHLQNLFRKNGVYGVNNGVFSSVSAYPSSEQYSLEDIKEMKSQKRRSLLRLLASYKPSERFGDLSYQGRSIAKLPDNVPVFVMSGRLDPLQKGYDILLRALERFTEDEIKVVLTPLPLHQSDLDYFYEIACKCKGNVTVYPIKMERGYRQLQTGSTYGIMPSIYEPFGAAVEYMANGTVIIARATGGLVDQVDRKCGFLYREDAVFYTLENIQAYIESDDIVQGRKNNPWVISMSDNLHDVLKKAANLYRNNEDAYYRLILNGFIKVKKFNWGDSVNRYRQVFDKI
ncbi:MAG: glycogen/starch synthase [Nitrospiraceae bacterium]|nr:MAG: glycogen/starch synthase [Nitrospiraceae bacterium]